MRRHVLVLLAVLVVAALAAGAATAAPSPAVRAQLARKRVVEHRIAVIGRNLERTVQEYDGARDRLRRVERNLRLNEYALHVARANLTASRQRLAARLVSLYVDGQPSALDVLAGAKSLSEMIDRIESAQAISHQDAQLGRETLGFAQSVTRREALLRRQKRARAATVARLAEKRRTIEAAYASQQRLARSIDETIASIQAREAEQARRLAAAERARIAREVAARQAANQPDPAAALGLVSSPASVPIAGGGAGHPEAAQIAARYLGVPYVWGGASPGGFDCSGLVMYVYAQLGISLPHYTVSQWNATIPISSSELAPGDLVFFDGLGHVGIYIGNGQFIDAPHTGSVVRVDSIAGFGGFDGARRVP
ncbi:MAG TPA: NlpC/P60 family protein [Gaiellaceae bacterium]|nr:NlpC/P60 family protein [Gaiellaceae bacterium]